MLATVAKFLHHAAFVDIFIISAFALLHNGDVANNRLGAGRDRSIQAFVVAAQPIVHFHGARVPEVLKMLFAQLCVHALTLSNVDDSYAFADIR